MYVIGVDLGTQSMKGLLIDPEGKTVAESSHSHDPSYPNPAGLSRIRLTGFTLSGVSSLSCWRSPVSILRR